MRRPLSACVVLSLATTVFGLRCHYYAHGELDGKGRTLTQDRIVECSTADAKFCFTLHEDIDDNGDDLKAVFRGCNADPIYGKLQGDSDGYVLNECTQDGETPVYIPGVLSADILTCCSTDACNDDGGVVPGGDGGTPGGNGVGTDGSHHKSAGRSTIGISLLTIVMAYFLSQVAC